LNFLEIHLEMFQISISRVEPAAYLICSLNDFQEVVVLLLAYLEKEWDQFSILKLAQ